jgi:hypothetical protein
MVATYRKEMQNPIPAALSPPATTRRIRTEAPYMSRRNRHSRKTSAHHFSAPTYLRRWTQANQITTSVVCQMILTFLHLRSSYVPALVKCKTHTRLPSCIAYPIWIDAPDRLPQSGEVCVILVGVRGLEPPTSASRTLRASRLRYTPVLTIHASDSLALSSEPCDT